MRETKCPVCESKEIFFGNDGLTCMFCQTNFSEISGKDDMKALLSLWFTMIAIFILGATPWVMAYFLTKFVLK